LARKQGALRLRFWIRKRPGSPKTSSSSRS